MFMDFVDVAKIVNHYGVPNNFLRQHNPYTFNLIQPFWDGNL